MAVTPRRRGRAVETFEPSPLDPLEQIVEDDELQQAGAVGAMLDDLRGILTDDTKIIIYRLETRGGKPLYLKTLVPPINVDNLLDDLKDDFGGGDYLCRIYAKGRVVTAKRVSIDGPPKRPGEQAVQQRDTMGDFLPMIMSQQERASSENMRMMTMMMEQSRQSSQNNMTMLTTLISTGLPLVMGMMGSKESATDLLSKFATIQQQLNPPKPAGDMMETIKTFAALKELMGGDGGGGGEESMIQTALKTLGPMMGDALSRGAGAVPAQPVEQLRVLPGPAHVPPPGQSFAPNPSFQVRSPTVEPPIGPQITQVSGVHPAPRPSGVLGLISQDVLFMAGRFPPAVAAEAMLSRIEGAEVPEHELMAMVLRFQSSADWLSDLAAEGIDIRQHREWATEFLSELVTQYTEAQNEAGDEAGGSGGETDPG